MREQGHGRRHIEVSGVSAVASCWQIQHRGTSGVSSVAGVDGAGGSWLWAVEDFVTSGLFKTKEGSCDSEPEAEG